MSALKNETGKKYGRLSVLRRGGNSKSGKALWVVSCSCGSEPFEDLDRVFAIGDLRSVKS